MPDLHASTGGPSRRGPRSELPRGWSERIIRCAILAPSSHNTQPWRFIMSSEYVELWADRSRQLPVCDPQGRELVLSCGAALMNLRVACHRLCRETAITLLPDSEEPDRLASVSGGGERPARLEDQHLFEAVFRRRTHRGPFETRSPLGEGLIGRLLAAAEREGASLLPLEGAARKTFGELLEEATRTQFRDRRYRRELASWMRSDARRPDGIPGHAFGFGPVGARLAPWILRSFDIGGAQAARDRALVESAPLVAVLGSDRDSRTHWLRVGQALERVLLVAASEGLSASYLNAPIQAEAFRSRVAELIGGAVVPQVALRLGFAGASRPTLRRPLTDVIKPLA